jgi:hypothetical protein
MSEQIIHCGEIKIQFPGEFRFERPSLDFYYYIAAELHMIE